MDQSRREAGSANLFFMVISAALFAWFGFFAGMTATAADGTFVLFFAILLWTLRAGAIGFAISAVLTFPSPLLANLLYALVGLGTSIGLVIVAVMDIADKTYIAAIPPFWAFLFAAWNGYGSWTSMREIMASRRVTGETAPM